MTKKIYNVTMRAQRGRWCYGLSDVAGLTASRALGHHGDDGIASSGRTMALWARGRHMSMAPWDRKWRGVHNVAGSGRAMLLRDRESHRRLGDDACMVDGITSSGRGRWQSIKGPRPWLGMMVMVQRLRVGTDDSTGSWEVDDGAASREIFGRKFWQPNGLSESLWELGFAKTTQWFIYRGTIVATSISDVSRAIATENHN
jgi:hypothetical protein